MNCGAGSSLDREAHDDRGHDHRAAQARHGGLEAGFGPVDPLIPPLLADLDEAQGWIEQRLLLGSSARAMRVRARIGGGRVMVTRTLLALTTPSCRPT
jgi:hypothetical protein